MATLNKQEMRANFVKEYAPLLKNYYEALTKLKEENVPGIQHLQVPHLPIIGSEYYEAECKIAIYGIETRGWFVDEYQKFLGDCKDYFENNKDDESVISKVFFRGEVPFERLDHLVWRKDFPFWNFHTVFFSKFYGVDRKALEAGKYPEIMKSFIYGNMHAMEKYEAAKPRLGDQPMDKKTYNKKVLKASECLDGGTHILKVAQPKVMIMLGWSVNAHKWINSYVSKNPPYELEHQEELDGPNGHLRYYHIKETDTHIFWTVHPRAMNFYGNTLEGYVDIICQKLHKLGIKPQKSIH